MAVTTRIASARIAAGYRYQGDLAKAMQRKTGDPWPLSRMSKVERGIEVMSPGELEVMAELLQVEPSDLYPRGVLDSLRSEPAPLAASA